MARVTREKEMDVGVKFLEEAVTRFEDYPSFLPEVVSSKRLSAGNEPRQRVQFELEIVKRFQYELVFDIVPGKEVRWSLAESNFFKINEGRWGFRPIDAGTTHVQYEVEVGFGFFVPGWITKKLTEVNLPKMLDSFEAQAKKLQEREKKG